MPKEGNRVKVVRIIARLNVGGPAIQAITLTHRLRPLGYDTLLLRGALRQGEGSMDHLAETARVRPVSVPGLRRDLGASDLRALWEVMRWLRRVQPEVLHTHTAKAGMLGRLAASITPGVRPRVIVHTFHGHVFEGEFSRPVSRVFAFIERLLATRTTRIVAVSDEVKDDLVRLRVAPPEKIEVVRLGFDLAPFASNDDERDAIRRATRMRLGVPEDASVVSVIARVTKVKRIDRFIEMARLVLERHPNAWFLVVGDGDQRARLQTRGNAALGKRLVWAGFQRDIAAVCFASDVVALTSDNEGTPVCLIEAQAAAVPVVTTLSGGVETVVQHGRSGFVVERNAQALADAVTGLLDDAEQRRRFGHAGRAISLERFGVDRLVQDIDTLYRRLLGQRT